MQPGEKMHVKAILSWMSCSKSPLRKQEVIQALMVHEGDKTLVLERRIVQDIKQMCGPLIELRGDFILYVHYTAQK